MAVRKKDEPQEAVHVEVKEEQEPVKIEEKPPAETTVPVNHEPGPFVYIGPTVLGSRLQSGKVFSGTRADAEAYLADEITKTPHVGALVVPVASAAQIRKRTRQAGSAYSRYCREIREGRRE